MTEIICPVCNGTAWETYITYGFDNEPEWDVRPCTQCLMNKTIQTPDPLPCVEVETEEVGEGLPYPMREVA